jgi:hypothetical protein
VSLQLSRDLKHHSFCALENMMKGSEERKGGGYLQREKKRKLEPGAKPMQQSALAQYMVLKPPPLDIPPQQNYVFAEVFKIFRTFKAGVL